MADRKLSINLEFSDREENRSSYRSYANLLNVVHAELQLLERMSRGDAGLRPMIRLCEIASRAFRSRPIAADHSEALTEFKTRVRTHISALDIEPRYEDDAAEAVRIIEQVLDDADLRVQEAVARHALPRPREPFDVIEATSLLHAIEPKLDLEISGEVYLPHGLLEAVGRLATAFAADGVTLARSEESGEGTYETVVDLRGARRLDPAQIPSLPPPSFQRDGSRRPVPALLALLYYLVTPNGEVILGSDGRVPVRIGVK